MHPIRPLLTRAHQLLRHLAPILARRAQCRALATVDPAAYDVVCIYEAGGFGHHIAVPDALRRLYPAKRILLVLGVVPATLNPLAATLFQDQVDILHYPMAAHLWGSVGLELTPAARTRAAAQLHDKLGGIGSAATLHDIIRLRDHNSVAGSWEVSYRRLCAEVLAPPVHLPTLLREPIQAALDRLAGPRRLATLYLRQKGSPAEPESFSRNGSDDFDDYVPAILALRNAGYRVLLIGDRRPTQLHFELLHPFLVDARILGLDTQAFALFAATECDIFIGEAGGGLSLPLVNRIPTLAINVPPGVVTGATMTAAKRNGRCLTPDELVAAVADFLTCQLLADA